MHSHRITASVADQLFTITTQPLYITAVIWCNTCWDGVPGKCQQSLHVMQQMLPLIPQNPQINLIGRPDHHA